MHPRYVLGIFIAALAILITTLHFAAFQYFLYWRFWWFDIVMHFLGGVFIACAAFWAFAFEIPVKMSAPSRFKAVLLIVIAVGIAWEVFEFVFGLYWKEDYPFDTALDLAMDAVGAFAACLALGSVGLHDEK